MPEYLAPGVYVEEIDTGSKPIEGVSTSTAGMVGVAERGPVDVPILVTSSGEYERLFGGLLDRDFGPHRYLPHAVEGFFTNGGKRLYVVRVLDTENALRARMQLFSQGAGVGADTVLLRAVPERSGTTANPPLLYALSTANMAQDDWVRIGDGSAAEYRQVAANPAEDAHVTLNFPLSRSHDAGSAIERFARSVTGPSFTLDGAADVGDGTVLVTGVEADLDTLEGLADPVIEVGGTNVGEYHAIDEIQRLATDQAQLRLRGRIGLERADGTGVEILDLSGLPGSALESDVLGVAASAGDHVVFIDDATLNFDDRTTLIVIERADVARREVRRIGELRTLPLSVSAYATYPLGAAVERVTLAADQRAIQNDPSTGDTTLTLDDVDGIAPGQTLTVGASGSEEDVIVLSVDAGSSEVTFTTGFANDHGTGDPVQFTAMTLEGAVEAGSRSIALDTRLGLEVGDVLRIGVAPQREFAEIAALPGQTGVGQDPGFVTLRRALRLDHSDGTEVVRQGAPALQATQVAFLVLAASEGETTLAVTDGNGFSDGDIIRVRLGTDDHVYHILSDNAAEPAAQLVALDSALARAHPSGAPLVERDPLIEVHALDAGAWGNRLRVSVENEARGLVASTTLETIIDDTHVRLSSARGVETGTVLELTDPDTGARVGELIKVVGVDRSDFTLTLDPGLQQAHLDAHADAQAGGTAVGVRSLEFSLTVHLLRQPDPAQPSRNDTVIDSETFRYLSMDPRHSRYFASVIGAVDGELRAWDRRPEGASAYVRVYDLAEDLTEPDRTDALHGIRSGPEALVDVLSNGRQRPARHAFTSGDDALAFVTDDVFIGDDADDPEDRTGLQSLRNVDEVSIVAIPGQISVAVQDALISHCETDRYRFAVLDGPVPPGDTLADVQAQRQQFDTKYAALYYPWLHISDPFPANLELVRALPIPPSGHVGGVYARTDVERGVHKAPANEVVRGILGLSRVLNKSEHDILNPSPVNINVIRDFRESNRGIRVWGARVITSDPDFKYVPVRRLLIFIEESIDDGLQWVVFEPNAEPLWARVRRTISDFLRVVWRNGALEGTTEEQAFFVKCDRTTMTQTDIDNGRLICLVGVAPVKPAEYVIIRIGLKTAEAES